MLKTICPTGNLGDTPFEEETFFEGLKIKPDFLGADSGSSDIGPTFLGGDIPHNPEDWEMHDLRLLLKEARRRKIPLLIGSCGSTGTDRGVNLFLNYIKEIAKEEKLSDFKVATIYSNVSKDYLLGKINRNIVIPSLGTERKLTVDDVEKSDHIVAMMGVEPYIEAIKMGADVIIAGRSCDDAICAAIPIMKGYDKGLSLHLGKVLECASLVGTPQMVKETVIGKIYDDYITIKAVHKEQAVTPQSAAAHSMYERSTPHLQATPGGTLDMYNTKFEKIDEKGTKISGSRFIPAEKYYVKLEGAGFVGYKAYSICGVRDTIAIKNIDLISKNVMNKISSVYHTKRENKDYYVNFHIYGKNGVMGTLEPVKRTKSHEIGIVIDVVAKSPQLAGEIAKLAKFRFNYEKYPGQINASTGGIASIIDEVLRPDTQKAYRWTIDHLLPLDNPLEVFPIKIRRF